MTRVWMMLACLLLAGPASAANLYVNNSGSPACSDSTTKASNSASSPWCTLQRAFRGAAPGAADVSAQAASAGDTVYVTAGTYSVYATGGTMFESSALYAVNSGTSGNPIRMQAIDNAACVINLQWGDAGRGTILSNGISGQNYIEYSGFNIDEDVIPWQGEPDGYQGGAVAFVGGEPNVGGSYTVGHKIENSCFEGTPDAEQNRTGDNYTAIRLHGVDGVTIKNNYCRYYGTNGGNATCTTWYFAVNVTVEHNDFGESGNCMYMKGQSDPTDDSTHIIRYNKFTNCYYGIRMFANANGDPGSPILVYQNIVTGGTYSIQLVSTFTDSRAPNDIKIINNILWGATEKCVELNGELLANVAIEFHNNICSASFRQFGSETGGTTASFARTRFLADHNLYQFSGNFSDIGPTDFATWQGTYGQDNTSPVGQNANPRFVDSAGGDFRLCTGSGTPAAGCTTASPGLTMGRVVYSVGGSNGATIPAGVYISGSEVIGLDITPPAGGGSGRTPLVRVRVRG